MPIIIVNVISATNPGIDDPMKYNYTAPMCVFAALGGAALVFGIILKIMNSRHHYGLEEPNIKADYEEMRIDGEA